MPAKSLDEIKEMIEGGDITAISIDTTTFDGFHCNLEYKGLVALEQFKGSDIRLILTPVTVGEVKRHIGNSIAESAEKARAGINQLQRSLRSKAVLADLLDRVGANVDPVAKASEMTAAFIAMVGADIIGQEASSRELLERFFDVQPPFGTSKDKKSEFPDAIALISLREWARENKTQVLVVSNDGDWQTFADQSAELVCVKRLPEALNLFHANESVIASRISNVMRRNGSPEFRAAIESALERVIEEYDVEAVSSYMFEEESGIASLVEWQLNDTPISVVASDADQITLDFEIDALARFEAHFRFYLRDGIDRDYVRLGSSREYRDMPFTVSAAVTFYKDNGGDTDPIEVELVNSRYNLSVDFGEVEPER